MSLGLGQVLSYHTPTTQQQSLTTSLLVAECYSFMDYVNLSVKVKRLETICIHQYCAVKNHTEDDIAILQNNARNLEDFVSLNAKHSNNFSVEIDTCIEGNYQHQQGTNKEVQVKLNWLDNWLLDLEETVWLFKRAIGAPGSTDTL